MDESQARPRLLPELPLALLAALVIFAWPLRAGLFDPDRILFGVDSATAQLPWSAVIDAAEDGPVRRPRNPALSDQGVVFYPFYLWVARSWARGDPPTWNPLIYAGVPGIANPQSGALDPQVWALALLHRLGGEGLFHHGLSILAWLRLVAAGLGAYLLARCLGLARAPAALAGVTFGLSGFQVLWLNHSLGHVSPLLPWVLLGLEGIRGGRRPLLALAGTALALGLAILGGHPETAFYVGATGGVWALCIGMADRRAGVAGLLALALGTALASASLIPFVEYLGLSGAQAIRAGQGSGGAVDLVALGGIVVALGLALWYVRLQDETADGADALGPQRVLAALGIALAIGGTCLLLRSRGLSSGAALAVVPDLYGAPGSAGGYRGPGSYVEVASGWVALVSLALATASALSPRGILRRRRVAIPIAAVALILCLEVPGPIDLYRLVPLVGLGATGRLGAVSALMLALLAGDAVASAPRASRLAAGLLLALVLAGSLPEREPDPLPPGARAAIQEDELFGLLLVPPERLDGGPLALEGWLYPGLSIESGVVRVQKLDGRGRPVAKLGFDVPLELTPEPSPAARGADPQRLARVPDGATYFRASYLLPGLLGEGTWRFAVDLFGREPAGRPIATRVVGVSVRTWPKGPAGLTLALALAGLVLLVLAPTGGRGAWGWGFAALALVSGWAFARGTNPAVPTAEVFPETETERVLAEILGPHRFFSEPFVLPPDTGLVRDLRALDGYDGMDVASYDAFRHLALRQGAQPLLAWNARGVDLSSPAFRLLGVAALALRGPLEHPDWELVAGPGAERPAECWIYRARAPLPRAFCASEVVSPDELRRLESTDPGAWDPLRVACIDGDWRPRSPFTRADVSVPVWTNATVTVRAELDGDGLLVLTDQDFPGWTVTVDGREGEIHGADGIFRGVPLGPGEHEVLFRYEPWTLRLGAWLSLGALAVTLAFAGLGLRDRGAAIGGPR